MSEGIQILAKEIIEQVQSGASESDVIALLSDGIKYDARENNCNIPHVVSCADNYNWTEIKKTIEADRMFRKEGGIWRHHQYGGKTTLEAYVIAKK